MKYTDPIDPAFPEPCMQDTTIDQSTYTVPPAPGGTVDPVAAGEPLVVESQFPYPVPLTYSDLPHSSPSEWRLMQPLRAGAARPGTIFSNPIDIPPLPGWDARTPLETLKSAARAFAASGGKQLQSQHSVRAMADLAVTGRLAYEALSRMNLRTPQEVVTAMALDPSMADAALEVVLRAQNVAWAIRGNPNWRRSLRPHLGWIGVSGEDDVPHRPCNVFSLSIPQHDVTVRVGGLNVTTRIVIAEAPYPPPFALMENPPTFLPPDETPAISPDSDVIFFYMPGDCSRAEEAADMIPAIFQAAAEHGKKATVISFDMIGWGYSARRAFDTSGKPVLFDQTFFPTVSYPNNPPALQFVEDFVVALIQTLSSEPPYIDLRKVVPIGGSLGGNLALRLGRRSDLWWLKAVCGWSPASVWPSKATNPDTGTLVGYGAGYGAAAGAILGTVVPGIGNVIGAAVGAVVGAAAGAVAGPWGDRATIGELTIRMNTPEDGPQRSTHFAQVFDNDTLPIPLPGLHVPPQATMWYRDDWSPCKDNSICRDRLDRREVYDVTYRRWHWRISQDQLVYSHRDSDPATGTPRYLLNSIPMLLAAGVSDDYPFANIYSWTRDLASKMTVPGTSLFLKDTGHSIHNERPTQLAHALFDFLDAYWQPAVRPPIPQKQRKDVSYLVPLLLGS